MLQQKAPKWIRRSIGLVACGAFAVLACSRGVADPPAPKPAPAVASAQVSEATFAVAEPVELKLRDAKRDLELAVRVVYPGKQLGDAANGGEALPTKWPLVVFSHGMGGSFDAFEGLAKYLAARGFVVIRPTHSDSIALRRKRGEDVRGFARDPKAYTKNVDLKGRVLDCSLILDSLDVIESKVAGLKHGEGRGMIDRERIAMAGHSAGAMTTQLSIGAKGRGLDRTIKSFLEPVVSIADPRFKAGIIVSGAGTKSKIFTEESYEIAVPILVITGSLDLSKASSEDPESRKSAFMLSRGTEKGGPPAWLMFIEGATHSSYSGKGAGQLLDGSPRGATDPEIVARVTNEVVARFLNAVLLGDGASQEWLSTPSEIAALSQGTASVESK